MSLGDPVRHLAVATSTMDAAAAWTDAPHGAVVVAETQTASPTRTAWQKETRRRSAWLSLWAAGMRWASPW